MTSNRELVAALRQAVVAVVLLVGYLLWSLMGERVEDETPPEPPAWITEGDP